MKDNFLVKKRGVSPVVATVLLIGMVVVLSMIVFLWFRGFTQEAVTKFDVNVELVCNDVKFNADYDGNTLSIVNIGNVPIYKMKLKVSGFGGYTTRELASDDNWPDLGIVQGAAYSQSMDLEGEEITLVPILIGEVKGGKKTFTCDEAQYGLSIRL